MSPKNFLWEICRGISGMRLNKCLASICQTLALYAQGLIVSLAAYFGYLVLAYILQGIGFWQSMVGFDAGYVVAALLSLLSPLYIVVLPIMAQVRSSLLLLTARQKLTSSAKDAWRCL